MRKLRENERSRTAARIFIAFLLLGVLKECVFAQTCIVIRKTEKELFAGADSKGRQFRYAHNGLAVSADTTTSICKIVKCGNLFFAAAGIIEIEEIGFDLYEIARQAGLSEKPASDKIRRIENSIIAPLTKTLSKVRQTAPPIYDHYVQSGPVQLALFGIEAYQPVLLVRGFTVRDTGQGQISVVRDSSRCRNYSNGTWTAILGRNKEIFDFLADHPKFWNLGPVAGIRRLIEIEVKAVPEEVGPPIDLLRVTEKGAEWIQRKATCQDIQ
ncbi:MAG: hypothetical protein ACE5IY_05475 [bacterium]